MLHPRTEIRRAMVALLRTPLPGPPPVVYPTIAGKRVFEGRSVPLSPKALPAILVYNARDTPNGAAPRSLDAPTYRNLDLMLEIAAIGEDADDQVDAVCLQIEAFLREHSNLGGACEWALLGDTEFEPVREGENEILAARMTVNVAYWSDIPIGDGTTPQEIYGSYVPLIGPPNLPYYVRIDQGQLPDIG